MKSFQLFQEDVKKLRQDLDTIAKQDASHKRLSQRRQDAAAAAKSRESDSDSENLSNLAKKQIEITRQKNIQSGEENKQKAEQTKAKGKSRAAIVGGAIRQGIKQTAYTAASATAKGINKVRSLISKNK